MTKPSIFLIHGSWHWGGCFQKVADALAASGYPVATPDLTSHGFSDASWSDVDSMETYTKPVQKLLELASEPVVLVGHSMGGVSLTYLAEHMPQKIRCLVYLSAFMTPAGKCANDYLFSYARDPIASSLFQIVTPVENGAGLAVDIGKPDLLRDAFYADCSETDIRIAKNNAVLVNSSIPNVYVTKTVSDIERHYITCSQDHAIPLAAQMQMIEDVPGAAVHALQTSHSPFFSAADPLSSLIMEIAA